MIYLYTSRGRGRELAAALGATRLTRFDGLNFWLGGQRIDLLPNDTVVCWGAHIPPCEARVINPSFGECSQDSMLKRLNSSGYYTPIISAQPGAVRNAFPVVERVSIYDTALTPPSKADYWVSRVGVVKEYVLHVAFGSVVAHGIKVPAEGFVPGEFYDPESRICHSWIRSARSGWTINYKPRLATTTRTEQMALAEKISKRLGIHCCRITLGMQSDRTYYTLKVDSGPREESFYIGPIKNALVPGPQFETVMVPSLDITADWASVEFDADDE